MLKIMTVRWYSYDLSVYVTDPPVLVTFTVVFDEQVDSSVKMILNVE